MADYRTMKSEMYEDISSDEEWDDVRVIPENKIRKIVKFVIKFEFYE